MTYEKIAQLTGEPLRSVQFDFPRQDAWLLCQLPGMKDFDNNIEVLDLVKALWGLKDAPRAFGLKLAETLRSVGFTQGIIDPQLWRKYKSGTTKDSGQKRNLYDRGADLLPEGRDGSQETTGQHRSLDIGTENLGENLSCIIQHGSMTSRAQVTRRSEKPCLQH